MQEKAFNLLDEPWIRVLRPDYSVEEVSLTDALVRAKEFRDLAGELPTQDAAVLRLLLAVAFTVFSRVDKDGNTAPLQTTDEALVRWISLWEYGELPAGPIREYLAAQHERFWLFHPERPFYQVAEADGGTSYGAPKLNGEISESSNKTRLFQAYAGIEKESLTYAQAARWLLYINGFDDASAKPKEKNLPQVGAGWLGRLGLIFAKGDTLAETLLLNLTLLKDGTGLWPPAKPCWELSQPRAEERVEIPQPNDLAALLTLQSRRLHLKRAETEKVTGFSLLGGDFFEPENAFCEQMTVWKKFQVSKNTPIAFVPKRHDPAKQFWREFPAVFTSADDVHTPGVVSWLSLPIVRKTIGLRRIIRFQIVGVVYGANNSSISDILSDQLAFHAQLLDTLGKRCRIQVEREIDRCARAADCLWELACELAKAAGSKNMGQGANAKAQFYFRIDGPFRQWLAQLDPEQDMDALSRIWGQQAKAAALTVGRELIDCAGATAMIGRSQAESKKTRFFSAPKAFNRFLSRIQKIYE